MCCFFDSAEKTFYDFYFFSSSSSSFVRRGEEGRGKAIGLFYSFLSSSKESGLSFAYHYPLFSFDIFDTRKELMKKHFVEAEDEHYTTSFYLVWKKKILKNNWEVFKSWKLFYKNFFIKLICERGEIVKHNLSQLNLVYDKNTPIPDMYKYVWSESVSLLQLDSIDSSFPVFLFPFFPFFRRRLNVCATSSSSPPLYFMSFVDGLYFWCVLCLFAFFSFYFLSPKYLIIRRKSSTPLKHQHKKIWGKGRGRKRRS